MQRFFEENYRKNLSLKFIHINNVTHLCSFHFIVFPQLIHNSIKGLLALSLVFSLFVLEKASYPILSESIHSEWLLESNEVATYQSVFSFILKKEQLTFQSIDKALLFIQASLVKVVLTLTETLSLYTIFINKLSTFHIRIFSSEVPYFHIQY
ncbi:MAG: hypothetical protein ACI85O_003413 [Saprospiraceae bacterium]|jgi:hypothetical protein